MIFAYAHIISPGFSLFYLFWGCYSACFRVAAHTPGTARLGGKLDIHMYIYIYIHMYIYIGKMTSFSPLRLYIPTIWGLPNPTDQIGDFGNGLRHWVYHILDKENPSNHE